MTSATLQARDNGVEIIRSPFGTVCLIRVEDVSLQAKIVTTDPIDLCDVTGADDARDRDPHPMAARLAELERLVEEQRQAIASLQTVERRSRIFLESVRGIAFYYAERNGARTFLGYDAQSITGIIRPDGTADLDQWYRAIDPADLAEYRACEHRRQQSGEGFTIAFRYRHPLTGREILVQEQGYPAAADDDRHLLYGHVVDLTEAHEQERRLREATEVAIAANQAKTHFLASMSHELRTPLNAVIGFSEVIIDQSFGPLGSDRYLEYCRDIHASATHLLRLVEDILDVSKIEAGRIELNEALIDVGRLINATLRMVRDRATDKGLSLTAGIEEHLPQLCADERRIRQILINLLSNAIKFTDSGGTVSVAAYERPDGGIDVMVADSGIGIAEADLPRVMKPFVQVHTGLTRQFEGSGIGLALSAKLAELHGGRLNLSSRLGSGTCVTLVLPPQRSMRPPARPTAPG